MKLNNLFPELLIQKNIPLPAGDNIDICIFSIEDFSLLAGCKEFLPEQDLQRSASFRQEKDRLRYAASRILLRKVLSLYLNYPPEKLIFKTGNHGKPYLFSNGNNFPKIHFSLSHSGELIALAFSATSPIGIDIEAVRSNIRTETLVRRFFHTDEYSEFLKLDTEMRKDFVFRRWTVREAFLKGIGTGFATSPESFYVQETASVSSDSSNERTAVFCIKKSQKDYSSWRIMPILVPDNYYCSIAYQIQTAKHIS